jgi:IS605 OrfB family transposase
MVVTWIERFDLRFALPRSQAEALAETTSQFTESFNAVCAHGWKNREKNGVTLHHETYRALKDRLPKLVSDLHIQARVKATEAVRSALALSKKGRKVSCPKSTNCPPRLNVHTFKLNWSASEVKISTTAGRLTVPFSVPAYGEKFSGLKVATADLIQRNGRWALHVVIDVPPPEVVATDEVLGVDLGIVQPAVTSSNLFLGKRCWRNIEAKTFKLKRALQHKGTKSAKRHLRKLKGRQARFRRDCDHVVSKQVVAAVHPGATIVVENLQNIRKRTKMRKGQQARRLHGWSFAQLRSFIEYKAEERGCTVVGVDPRHTSQTCSRCGHVARNNRRSRGWFKCRACGFELHADLNGARNIAAKYQASGSTSSAGGPSVNRPIVGDEVHASSTCKPPPSGDGG